MEAAQDKRELFETMPVGKALRTLAIPTIISQLISLIYNMADTFFIGRTGNSYMMAGVSLSFTLFMLTVALSNLFGIGGGSLMARLAGQHRIDRAKVVSAFSFYASIGIALLYSLVILAFLNPLLYTLGASARTILYARQYVIYVIILGGIPTILGTSIAHLLRNAGYSRQASIGLSGGGILNIALDPLFMFVIFPDGHEVAGAAFATMLSNIISCIYLIVVYVRTESLSLRFSDAKKISASENKQLLYVGVPSAILTGLFDVANIFLNSLMAAHGDLQLAAVGIVMKVERVPNAINIGICQGMLPLVAYNFSSGNHKRMREIIRRARGTGLLISFICMGLFELFATGLVKVFMSTSGSGAAEALQTIAYGTLFLRIRCLASPFQFLNYSSSFSMQGVGDGRDTLIHAVVRELGFYIPFMYLFNHFWNELGLVIALPVGEACGAVLAMILLEHFIRAAAKRGQKI